MERPTAEQAQQSLRDHVVMKAAEARDRCGGRVDRAALALLLADRSVVRYPLGVRFDAEPLRQGEFACLEALGERPEDGFCLFVHPMFEAADDLVPLLVAYYVPSVNYGSVATHEEAELYGAALTGLDREQYYRILCSVADQVTPKP
ncbi:MAG: hypothetical protein FJ253_00200 [Phycisphaerae bacterium]|nr:hypothetical protein [Phycisphaerae bacterium]